MNSLYDFYAELLTEKQRTYVELYYGYDYSLGEIADEFEISRQAVNDNIRRTEKILKKYENQLHMVRDFYARETIGQEALIYVKDKYPADEKLQQYFYKILSTDEEFDLETTEEV